MLFSGGILVGTAAPTKIDFWACRRAPGPHRIRPSEPRRPWREQLRRSDLADRAYLELKPDVLADEAERGVPADTPVLAVDHGAAREDDPAVAERVIGRALQLESYQGPAEVSFAGFGLGIQLLRLPDGHAIYGDGGGLHGYACTAFAARDGKQRAVVSLTVAVPDVMQLVPELFEINRAVFCGEKAADA